MPTNTMSHAQPSQSYFILRVYLYIFKETVLPFVGGVVFFTFVFLMFQAVRLADYFINHGVGLGLLTKLTVYISSAFLPVVLPISFLVAVLVAFGRMSADSEIVAFKASGVSIYRLYMPVFFTAIAVSAAVFYLAFYYIPWANYQFKRTVVKLGNTKVVSNLKEGTFTEGFFDLLIYTEKIDRDRNRLENVFIYDERDSKSPSAVVAKYGTLIPQKTDSEFSTAAILKLEKGAIHHSDLSRTTYEKIHFNEYQLLLKVDEGQSGEISYPKTRTQPQLRHAMQEYLLAHDQDHYVEYASEYWRRVALGICPLLFSILAVGLGTVRMRSVKSNAVLMCVGIVLIYWVLNLAGAALAERRYIDPFLAMQFSNLLMLPFAVAAFRKASW